MLCRHLDRIAKESLVAFEEHRGVRRHLRRLRCRHCQHRRVISEGLRRHRLIGGFGDVLELKRSGSIKETGPFAKQETALW